MSRPETVVFDPEARSQNAADILTRQIPYKSAYDFVNSCSLFADIIDTRYPDIVFIPQRGAGPIQWVTEEFISQAGQRMPLFVDLPIGTHTITEGDSRRSSGISGLQKRQLVQEAVDSLAAQGKYVPGVSRLMLIDEVQKGGTITQAAQALSDAMERVREREHISDRNKERDNLYVVAAQDNRGNIQDERKESYKKLVMGRPGFTTIPVPTTMFTVDRAEFLNEILKVTEGDIASLDDLTVKQNETARHLFKTLAHVFLAPKQALEELEDLRTHIIAQDLGSTVLQAEMLEALTNPYPVKRGKGATEEHTFSWWYNFCSYRLREMDSEQSNN